MRNLLLMWVAVFSLLLSPYLGIAKDFGNKDVITAERYYAIIVGVADYDKLKDLQYADDDAVALYRSLTHGDPMGRCFGGWREAKIELLLSPKPKNQWKNFNLNYKEATFDNIKKAIDEIFEKVANDINTHGKIVKVLIYLSGHGELVNGKSAFCPKDAIPKKKNYIFADLFTKWLEEGVKRIKESERDKIYIDIILDFCHSGGFAGAGDINGGAQGICRVAGCGKKPDALSNLATSNLLKDKIVVLQACMKDEETIEEKTGITAFLPPKNPFYNCWAKPFDGFGWFTNEILTEINTASRSTSIEDIFKRIGSRYQWGIKPYVIHLKKYECQHPEMYDGHPDVDQEILKPIILASISKPESGYMYLLNKKLFPLLPDRALIMGSIDVEVDAVGIQYVEFYVDDRLMFTDYHYPFSWRWNETTLFSHKIRIVAYDFLGNTITDEIPVVVFNIGEQDNPPEPCIVEPSDDNIISNCAPDVVLIYGERTIIRAVDLGMEDDIAYALFEYSVDGRNWSTIGIDEEGDFEGDYLTEGENLKAGREGWTVEWNLSELEEGFYYIRVTMVDEKGNSGEDVEEVYYDPTPPKPLIVSPEEGATIWGEVPIEAEVGDEDVKCAIVTCTYITNNSYFEQRNLGSLEQDDVGPDGDDGINRFCTPTAAANALSRLAKTDNRLYPPGAGANKDLVVAKELSRKMRTDKNAGTSTLMRLTFPFNNLGMTDTVEGALRDYLRERGVGCNNPTGYTVTAYTSIYTINTSASPQRWVPFSSSANWKAYSHELTAGESVIVDIHKWDWGNDNKPGTADDDILGGHTLTGRSCNLNKNADGSYDCDFVDPSTGGVIRTKWKEFNGLSGVRYNGEWWFVNGIWAISSKQPKVNCTVLSVDCNPEDGWNLTLDFFDLKEGYYLVDVTMVDSVGNLGRSSVIVCCSPIDTEAPSVEITWPEDGYEAFLQNITIVGNATDDTGIVSIGSHHEWEGGEAWTSGTVEPPQTSYHFEWNFTLREGWNRITIYAKDMFGKEGEDNVTIFYYPPDRYFISFYT